jgi:hypothetical protein
MLILGGCSDAGRQDQSGDALEPAIETLVSMRPVPPGETWVVMLAYMENVSGAPIEIASVTPFGSGLQSTIRVLRTDAAPFPQLTGDPDGVTPAGIFKTYPPATSNADDQGCSVQVLQPIVGFVLAPGGEARILLLVEADVPGEFKIDGYRVQYEQDGRMYSQVLSIGLEGSVREGVKRMLIPRVQRPCIDGVEVLPSG